MLYAIAYDERGSHSPLSGSRCALWQTYGVPYYWSELSALHAYLRQAHLEDYFVIEVVSLAVALRLSEEMVEVFNGRRQVVPPAGLRPVVSESAETYVYSMHRLGIAIPNIQIPEEILRTNRPVTNYDPLHYVG